MKKNKKLFEAKKLSVLLLGSLVLISLFWLILTLVGDKSPDDVVDYNNQNLINEIDLSNNSDLLIIEKLDDLEFTSVNVPELEDHLSSGVSDSLSKVELNNLYYMAEEEKLAHDLYVKLSEMWNLPVFENISRAEATHMAAVESVLKAYGYDYSVNREIGVFNDFELQAIYDTFLHDAANSMQDALLIAGAVEELDMIDLDKYSQNTDNQDILLVYSNLKQGSENHLRAFVKNYQKTGNVYFPQYLSQELYKSIVSQ